MEIPGNANPAQGSAGTQLKLITCVVQRGKADKLVKAAMAAGANAATVFFARGMGIRERLGLLGLAIVPEKEVILIVCRDPLVEPLLDALTKAGALDVPGHGVAYVTSIERAVGLLPTAS